MDILDDMGVTKLSAKVFFLKVNYSFKWDLCNFSIASCREIKTRANWDFCCSLLPLKKFKQVSSNSTKITWPNTYICTIRQILIHLCLFVLLLWIFFKKHPRLSRYVNEAWTHHLVSWAISEQQFFFLFVPLSGDPSQSQNTKQSTKTLCFRFCLFT